MINWLICIIRGHEFKPCGVGYGWYLKKYSILQCQRCSKVEYREWKLMP